VLSDVTLSGDTSGPPVLIDDLEDGDTSILVKDGRQGNWYAYDDGTGGTRTEPHIEPAMRSGSKNAMCISGSGFTGYGGGIGFDLNNPGNARALYDASAYTGISFWARGMPEQFRANVVDDYSDPEPGFCSACYDHFQAPFTTSDDWQHYVFSWKQLMQQGFGDMQPNVCASNVFSLLFQWQGGGAPFELCLDDIAFTTAAGTPPETGTALPAPPALTAGGGCNCGIARSSGHSSLGLFGLLGLLGLAVWRRRAERAE
jgi:MYXO-CTERM domain-containing protein